MKSKNRYHQDSTFFIGDLQVFQLQTVEPTAEMINRPRKGRPATSLPIQPRAKKSQRKKKP